MEVFQNLDPLLKVFWFVAIPASLIFIVQTILSFFGGDSSDSVTDMNTEVPDGNMPFQLFSLSNLINFLLGFSWTGISLYNSIQNKAILIALALIVGSLFIYVFFIIIRQMQKLAENNSFQIKNTLNKTAEVYLAIPEMKKGKGKIMISVNGSYHELDAMTEKDRIPTGSIVKVIKIENSDVLIVETI